MGLEIFDDFKAATLKVFSFLESEHGFKRSEPAIHFPECTVEFINPRTLISITHEAGGLIWIWISKVNEKGDRESPFYRLNHLIKRVSPERTEAIEPTYVWGKRGREDIEDNLAAYADFLRNEGHGIVEGGFSMFKPEDRIGRPSA